MVVSTLEVVLFCFCVFGGVIFAVRFTLYRARRLLEVEDYGKRQFVQIGREVKFSPRLKQIKIARGMAAHSCDGVA